MNFDIRRRVLIIFAVILVLATAMYSYAAAGGAGGTGGGSEGKGALNNLYLKIRSVFAENDDYEGVIRFHVKANSNSEEDQALKLKVRDAVLEEVNKIMVEETVLRFEAGDIAVSAVDSKATDTSPAAIEDASVKAKLSLDEAREIILEYMPEIEEAAATVIEENGYDYSVAAELGITSIPRKTYGDVTFPAGNYEALTITIGEGEGDNWWCVLFPPLCIIDPAGETLEGIETDSVDTGEDRANVIRLKFKTKELADALIK